MFYSGKGPRIKIIFFFHLNGTLRRLLQVKIPSQFPLVLWNTSAEVVKLRYSIYFVFNTLFCRFSKARYPTILGLCISEHACLGLWPTTEWNTFSKRFIYFIILFVPIIIKCSSCVVYCSSFVVVVKIVNDQMGKNKWWFLPSSWSN